jgi:hypothetical protein
MSIAVVCCIASSVQGRLVGIAIAGGVAQHGAQLLNWGPGGASVAQVAHVAQTQAGVGHGIGKSSVAVGETW